MSQDVEANRKGRFHTLLMLLVLSYMLEHYVFIYHMSNGDKDNCMLNWPQNTQYLPCRTVYEFIYDLLKHKLQIQV